MGLFDNYNTEGAEKPKDFVGSGFKVFDADIYEATIKLAYRHQADGGALAIVFEFLLANGETYKEDVYFTNSKGEHKYKIKNSDKMGLMPGFVTVNNICLIASGKDFSKQDAENKHVKVWSSKEKAEVVAERPVLVDLIGKKVALGIRKNLENKQEKNQDGKYVTVAATKETNKIHTVFHPEKKATVNEAEAYAQAKAEGKPLPEPRAWELWLKNNKGQVYDDREIKDSGSKSTSSDGRSSGGKKKDDLFE